MLEHEETIKLLAEAQKGGQEAKERLIEHNTPLIKSIVRRYKNKGVDYDDLMQLGNIGFLKAIANYDEKFNVKFSTYAVPMIAGEVKRFLRDDGYIKVSRALKMLCRKIMRYSEEFRQTNGAEPTIEEIAKEFNIDAQEAVFALDSFKYPVSLYEKTDDSDEKSQSLIDKIIVEDKSEENLDKMILKDIINSLPEKEKKIILLRYYRDKTQSEISKIMGVSQVQISRLESKILKRIREKFQAN